MVGRRVVVTGLGVVSPLGVGAGGAWGRLVQGHTPAASLLGEQYNRIASKVVCRYTRPHAGFLVGKIKYFFKTKPDLFWSRGGVKMRCAGCRREGKGGGRRRRGAAGRGGG